jgi:hypothetical protein
MGIYLQYIYKVTIMIKKVQYNHNHYLPFQEFILLDLVLNTQLNIHFTISYLPAMQTVPNEAGRYEQTADVF